MRFPSVSGSFLPKERSGPAGRIEVPRAAHGCIALPYEEVNGRGQRLRVPHEIGGSAGPVVARYTTSSPLPRGSGCRIDIRCWSLNTTDWPFAL
jgi:hypothetical protein